MSYLDIINVICFYFAYSTLSPSSTLCYSPWCHFRRSQPLGIYHSTPLAPPKLRRDYRGRFLQRGWKTTGKCSPEGWWMPIPESVQSSWKHSRLWGSCSNWIWSCSLWGSWTRWPWKIPFSSTCVWFCDLWKPKALRFFCCWQKSSSGTHPEGQQAGLSLKGKVSAVSGFGCSDQAATIKAGFIKTAQKRRALPGPCFGRS